MKWEIYLGAALAFVVVGALTVLGVVHWGTGRYEAGVTDGRNQVLASYAQTAQQLQRSQDSLAAYSAAAGQQLNHMLGTALPTIQGQTHDTVETIRTVYVDHPVPAGSCGRPAGVQQALDDAVDRANAAVTAAGNVRPDAPAVSGTARAPAGDDRGHAAQ